MFRRHGSSARRHHLGLLTLFIALGACAYLPPDVLGGPYGHVYGGVTKQGWPVVVAVSPDRTYVQRAESGFDLNCRSGAVYSDVDDYENNRRIDRSGRFRASYRNDVVGTDGGGTGVYSSSVSGKFNRARTRLRLEWRLHETLRDRQGIVTDVCDSGVVRVTVWD